MRIACLCVVAAVASCAASAAVIQDGAPATAEPPPTLEKSADSGQADRVGPSDGALAPDGTHDLAFVAQLNGPISAIFLVSVDEQGKPNGIFQADTLVGQAESPPELGAKPSNGTSGLGVLEGQQVLNAKDGTLREIGPGPHRVTLYIAPSPPTAASSRLRVYVQRPDKSLVGGGTVSN